jgi:hypothetical protein
MAFRQGLAERKPPPSSAEAAGIGILQLAERFERPWDILGRHSDAAVDHLKDRTAILRQARADLHPAAGRRELHGIADQVYQDLPDAGRIGMNRRHAAANPDGYADTALPRHGRYGAHCGGGLGQIDAFPPQGCPAGLKAGEVQNILYQAQQVLTVLVDIGGIFPVLVP